MLSLDLDDFMFELKDGAVKHVGPSNRAATAKLYDVEGADVRAFGDKRVKLTFEDESGNEVEIALFPEQAEEVAAGLDAIRDDGEMFE
jgi:hypothetical protein